MFSVAEKRLVLLLLPVNRCERCDKDSCHVTRAGETKPAKRRNEHEQKEEGTLVKLACLHKVANRKADAESICQ